MGRGAVRASALRTCRTAASSAGSAAMSFNQFLLTQGKTRNGLQKQAFLDFERKRR